MQSKPGQLIDVAYNIEYGGESSVQSSLNMLYLLGYSGQGNLRIFGPSNEKYHVKGGNDQIPSALNSLLGSQIVLGKELVSISQNTDLSYSLVFRGSTKATVVDRVVLALPFSLLKSVDYSKANFGTLKDTAIQTLPMGTNSDPRRLHGWEHRQQFRHRNTGSTSPAVPRTAGAGPSGHHRQVQRQSDGRLLGGLSLDQGLLFVLEGRPVHGVFRSGEGAAREDPLRRRTHLARFPGLPERGRRNRTTGDERDPGRLQGGDLPLARVQVRTGRVGAGKARTLPAAVRNGIEHRARTTRRFRTLLEMSEVTECPCKGFRECPMCHGLRPCGDFGRSRWCPPCVRARRQSLRPTAKRRTGMPAGRICAAPGCDARLSIYNTGDRCALCLRGRERSLA